MQDLSKISVVLPSLDPDEKLITVVDGLLEYGSQSLKVKLTSGPRKGTVYQAENLIRAQMELDKKFSSGDKISISQYNTLENLQDKSALARFISVAVSAVYVRQSLSRSSAVISVSIFPPLTIP